MVYNATFNNLSVISWWSVLLVKETGENHRPVASHLQTLSHNVVSSTPRHERDSNSQLQWMIGTDCIVVINPNYHATTTETDPPIVLVSYHYENERKRVDLVQSGHHYHHHHLIEMQFVLSKCFIMHCAEVCLVLSPTQMFNFFL